MVKPIKIVIVGAGFGGIYALKNLHRFFHNNTNVQISLISENNYFLFTPLLHEVATGGINPENIIEPIRKILGCCLYEFYLGKVIKINIRNHILETNTGIINYDYLILAPGAETNFFDISGAKEHSFTLKSLDDAIHLKNHLISIIEKASHIRDRNIRKNILQIVVIGGGPTGVELVTELEEFFKQTFSHYYSKEVIEDISIILVQKGAELLPHFSKKLRVKSLEVLQKKGIKILFNSSVVQIKEKSIELSTGMVFLTETVVWVAGIKPNEIDFTEPVKKNANGQINVNEYLQLDDHLNIFAIGDIARVKNKDGAIIPALAQVAVQEAKIVAENIKRSIDNQNLKPFQYKNAGTLISLGQWMAAGEISNFVLWGHFTWWIWRTIYLSKLISWPKKMKVAVDWTINIFSPRDISQL